jgi:hypothetical protein
MWGRLGTVANINLSLDAGLGTSTTAQTQIPSTGSHRIVGVLDAAGQQIAILVDPTSNSYYSSVHGNNADAIEPWTPSGTLSFQSYCLIENLADQVNLSHVAFSTSAAVVTKVSTNFVDAIPLAQDSRGVYRVAELPSILLSVPSVAALPRRRSCKIPSLNLAEVCRYYLKDSTELAGYFERSLREEQELLAAHEGWSPLGRRERLLARRNTP